MKKVTRPKMTYEYCPYCEYEVELRNELRMQRCPKCHKLIAPCTTCYDIFGEASPDCNNCLIGCNNEEKTLKKYTVTVTLSVCSNCIANVPEFAKKIIEADGYRSMKISKGTKEF